MRVIFVAGPYRADTVRGIVENIRRAEAVALEIWKMGGAALCPHLNTALMDGALPDEVWLEGARVILRRCDAIVLMPGWRRSTGAVLESREAEEARLKIFDLEFPEGAVNLNRYCQGGIA